MSNNTDFDQLSFAVESGGGAQQQNGLADVSVENPTFDPFIVNDDGHIAEPGFAFPQSYEIPNDLFNGFAAATPSPNAPAPTPHSQTELAAPLPVYGPQVLPFAGFQTDGVGPMLGQGNTTPSNSSSTEEISHTFNPPPYLPTQWYPSAPLLDNGCQASLPEFSHSTTPSYGSLTSVITAPPPNQTAVVGIFGRPIGDDGLSYHSSGTISRQSSMSSIASYAKPATDNSALPPLPQVFSTQGKMSRMRSNSRMAPYGRHGRSDSVSSVLSTTTNGGQQYWHSQSGLESPLNSMSIGSGRPTIQHRRSQSKSSGNYASVPGRQMMSNRSMDWTNDIALPPYLTLDERSTAVDQALGSLAARANAMQSTNVAQHDKARSHWVRQWLRLSYSRDSDLGSQYEVSRKAMFASYADASRLYGIKAINSASFGKAVKSAYPGIKNRRLGRRHHSHYHYIALKPTTTVELERLNAHGVKLGEARGLWSANVQNGSIHFRLFPSTTSEAHSEPEIGGEEEEEDEDEGEVMEGPDTVMSFKRTTSIMSLNDAYGGLSSENFYRPSMARRHTTSTLPQTSGTSFDTTAASFSPVPAVNIQDLEGFPSSEQVVFAIADVHDGQQAWEDFVRHLQSLVECAATKQFYQFEDLCRQYWSALPHAIVSAWERSTMSWVIKKSLAVTLNHVISSLVESTVHNPASLSSTCRESLAELAESLEETMEECWSSFPTAFASDKLDIICRAAHTLHRVEAFIEWNGTLSTTLAQTSQSRQLLAALESIDIQHIADQHVMSMSPSCAWSYELVHDCINGLRSAFSDQSSSAQLARWIDEFIKSAESQMSSPSSMASGLMTITSEIVRGVSLRMDSHASQVQLLKLWLDEYVSIWQHRRAILFVGGAAQHAPEYTPLSIGVPSLYVANDSDPNTAVPQAGLSQNHGSASQTDASGFDSTIHLLAPGFDIDNMITPRQNLSMSDLIEPKVEPNVAQ